jgi:DNA polymerase-3 subunit epsilon
MNTNLELFGDSSAFVAFDTETTGLWSPAHRLVEIAGVKFSIGSDKIETFAALINPGRAIPPDAVEVHGITDEMVANAQTGEKVLAKFAGFCGNTMMIAHNAPFDISFLACESDRVAFPRMSNVVLDTVDIFKTLQPGITSYSLLSLSKHFGLANDQKHRALDDAHLVHNLFTLAITKHSGGKTLSQLLKRFAKLKISDWQLEEVALPDGYDEMEKALSDNLRVEIAYASRDPESTANQPPKTRVIRPRTVYSLRSKLYINAFCELTGEERTFRLDRIESYRVLG